MLGDEDEGVAAAAAAGDGIIGGESNGSRGWVGPFFFCTKMVISGGGMDLWGGVDGGLMMRGCFGDEEVE